MKTFCLLPLLMFGFAFHGAERRGEVLMVGDSEYLILGKPLYRYWDDDELYTTRGRKVLMAALADGYASKWTVRDGKFFLTGLSKENIEGSWEAVPPGTILQDAEVPVFANWFTGPIRAIDEWLDVRVLTDQWFESMKDLRVPVRTRGILVAMRWENQRDRSLPMSLFAPGGHALFEDIWIEVVGESLTDIWESTADFRKFSLNDIEDSAPGLEVRRAFVEVDGQFWSGDSFRVVSYRLLESGESIHATWYPEYHRALEAGESFTWDEIVERFLGGETE